MTNPRVSVIIPVYNVENYVENTIKSVLDQSFRNFELIVVDDGSSDNSGKIITNLGELDSRIQYHYQKNSGQAAARNAGVQLSKAEFVTFVDGDDILSPDFLQTLVSIMDAHEVEVVCLPHKNISVNSDYKAFITSAGPQNIDVRIFTGHDYARNALSRNGESFNTSFVSKLYKRSIFEDFAIPEGHFYEDLLGVPILFERISQAAWANVVGYYYLSDRPNSTVNQLTLQKSEDMIWALELLNGTLWPIVDLRAPLRIAIINNIGVAYQNAYSHKELRKHIRGLLKHVTIAEIISIIIKSHVHISKKGILFVAFSKMHLYLNLRV